MPRLALSLIFVFGLMGASSISAGHPVKLMTFNIRLASGDDGDNVWSKRREFALQVIEDADPDILGVQEAQPAQMDDLIEALPNYINVGVARRPDGDDEFSAIFFRRERFHLSDAGTLWLSDTPRVPGSRSWNNDLPRIATWVRLFDRRDQRRIVVMNTHWDHQSQLARLNSGKLLAKRVRSLGRDGDPVVVMGDFNATPDNPAMAALVEQGDLRDSFTVANPDEENTGTFNAFGRVPRGPKIDAILVSPQWNVKAAEIIRTRDGDLFPSDHWPVTATLSLSDDD
jgi:endonuclease/exonuclease/phosphatase family metal-dependent hydrolase